MNSVKDFISQRAKRKRLKRFKPAAESKVVKHHAKVGHTGNAYRHTNTGFRDDIGQSFRSSWESNVCRVFIAHGIRYQFEPMKFEYPVKRGNKSYVPDFFLPDTNEWLEVKGYLDPNSKTKLKRFKKYYPDEFSRLIVVTGSSKASLDFFNSIGVPTILLYKEFRDLYQPLIATWEGK